MKNYLILLSIIVISHCSLNKVVQHHGVHNLETKQLKLKINHTNKNDIIKIIGPPSTKSSFNNDVYIYIERKTSSSKLSKLGNELVDLNDFPKKLKYKIIISNKWNKIYKSLIK